MRVTVVCVGLVQRQSGLGTYHQAEFEAVQSPGLVEPDSGLVGPLMLFAYQPFPFKLGERYELALPTAALTDTPAEVAR